MIPSRPDTDLNDSDIPEVLDFGAREFKPDKLSAVGVKFCCTAKHLGRMRDLRARTEGIFQLTSDGLRAYVDAVDAHFATSIHFAQLIELYSSPDITGPD